MLKKTIMVTAASLIINLSIVGSTLAASNPSTTGQPNASCGASNAFIEPNGFSSGGFAIAEGNYAGTPGSHSYDNANSPHAFSQYDVACYQKTQNH